MYRELHERSRSKSGISDGQRNSEPAATAKIDAPPPSFRRQWAQEERDLLNFEDPGCDAIARVHTSEDKSEREAIRMEAEDVSSFWEDGRTFP